MRQKLLSISEAAKYLHVSVNTLRNWHEQRKLVPNRTPGGQRRYSETQLHEFEAGMIPETAEISRFPKIWVTATAYTGLGMMITLLLVFVWLPINTGGQMVYDEVPDLKLESAGQIDNVERQALKIETGVNKTQQMLNRLTEKIKRIELMEGPPTDVNALSTETDSSSVPGIETLAGIEIKTDEQTNGTLEVSNPILIRSNELWVQSGRARVLPGSTETVVKFNTPMNALGKKLPVVTITPLTALSLGWFRVTRITHEGFVIEIGRAMEEGVAFNWIAVNYY